MISFERNDLVARGRRHPFCAVCALLSVFLLFVSGFLWFWSRSLSANYRLRQIEGEAVLATLVSGAQVRQELTTLREISQRIDENLVAENNLPENVDYFYRIEERSKARLDD